MFPFSLFFAPLDVAPRRTRSQRKSESLETKKGIAPTTFSTTCSNCSRPSSHTAQSTEATFFFFTLFSALPSLPLIRLPIFDLSNRATICHWKHALFLLYVLFASFCSSVAMELSQSGTGGKVLASLTDCRHSFFAFLFLFFTFPSSGYCSTLTLTHIHATFLSALIEKSLFSSLLFLFGLLTWSCWCSHGPTTIGSHSDREKHQRQNKTQNMLTNAHVSLLPFHLLTWSSVSSHLGCRGPPFELHHQLRPDHLQHLGHWQVLSSFINNGSMDRDVLRTQCYIRPLSSLLIDPWN